MNLAKPKYERWITEDGLLLLAAWARDGLSDEEIAHNCGINRRTLWEWKKTQPLISHALARAREVTDIIVENAVYKKCTGYTVTVNKNIKLRRVECDPNTGRKLREYEELVPTTEEIYIPADTAAQKFWLINRKSDTWKEKQVSEEKVDTEVSIQFADELKEFLT